jgi:hypothetical protein
LGACPSRKTLTAATREPPPQEEWTDKQKMFVILAEIRQCINDDHLMAAQRKVMAIETLLKEPAAASARLREPQEDVKQENVRVELPKVRVQGFDRMFKKLGEILND